ncbi:MAG: type VI secretion system baseplate subunit TssF [Deltaproteobacteria bacterium]|jgi:type VI secretion system protein ImpG|nr:type VI secretion system baseplate subunit TssF [Deltaproteobacteria bacterium]
MTLKNFYQQELANLRDLGVEFSRDNPALAPMLAAKGDDPDVERLLEGVAFLSSLIRRQLKEGYPNLIQSLLWLVCPRVLLPTPSQTMMHFRPVQGFTEPIFLPKGAQLASIKVDGASARFSTIRDLTILPAAVTKVSVDHVAADQAILTIQVSSGAPLGRWLPQALSIHFAGDYPEASERRRVILRHVLDMEAVSQGRSVKLGRDNLVSGGDLDLSEVGLISQPFAAFDLLKAYFCMPQQFLYLNVSGLSPLASSTDNTLSLKLRLGGLTKALPALRPEHLLLNVTPAINVFPHPAQPLAVDHRSDEYLIRPQDWDTEKLGVYSVGEVNSISASGQPKKYVSYENITSADKSSGLYSLLRRQSPVSDAQEYYFSVVYRPGEPLPTKEIISVGLFCHNVGVTEYLRSGEINLPTDSSPSMATFTNIIPPTRHSPPIMAEAQLWKLLSHLHMNILPFLSEKALKDILALHSIANDTDLGRGLANLKRIEAITEVDSRLEDMFIKGLPFRGTRVALTIDPSGFASTGDLHIFGDVLEKFFGLFHHINVYSRLTITEKNSLEVMSWPPRLGLKRLI